MWLGGAEGECMQDFVEKGFTLRKCFNICQCGYSSFIPSTAQLPQWWSHEDCQRVETEVVSLSRVSGDGNKIVLRMGKACFPEKVGVWVRSLAYAGNLDGRCGKENKRDSEGHFSGLQSQGKRHDCLRKESAEDIFQDRGNKRRGFRTALKVRVFFWDIGEDCYRRGLLNADCMWKLYVGTVGTTAYHFCFQTGPCTTIFCLGFWNSF